MIGVQIVTFVPIVLWIAALLGAGIAIWWSPGPVSFRLVADKLLRYLFIFPLGVQALWAFFSHVFMAEEAATAIGWAPSPFQYEVGVANLGLAMASFYAAFQGFGARAATAVAAACFLGGAGIGHVMDILQGDNLASGNAGPILYTDFLTPIVILSLLLAFPRRRKPEETAKTARAPSLANRVAAVRTDASDPRLEDELERARQAMREVLSVPPKPEAPQLPDPRRTPPPSVPHAEGKPVRRKPPPRAPGR